jgi:hypothetical protein
MRIGKRQMKRRLTGLTLPTVLGTGGGGATWEVEAGDKSRARTILQFFEDRRVLYNPYDVELPVACVKSVTEIREYLRRTIAECQSTELRDPLRAIQAACRQFLADVEEIEGIGGTLHIQVAGGGSDSWMFNQAIGSLRARVGTSVAIIAETFDVDIDEHLAKILPPPVDEEADETARLPHEGATGLGDGQ